MSASEPREPLLDIPRPLAGIEVVEIGASIAVAWAGRLLAELGATVTRIDHELDPAPRPGEPGVTVPGSADRFSAAGLHLHRGKRSVLLDLADTSDREALAGLVGAADIVLDGSGPGGASAHGFGVEQLRGLNPSLIVTVITAMGTRGPYRDYRASDLGVLAIGGLLNMVGYPDRQPLALGGAQVQYATGLGAFTGTMAALYRRDGTGKGGAVDVSMIENIAFIEWKSAVFFEQDGDIRRRVGDQTQWLVVSAADGYIALVYQDDQFETIRSWIAAPGLADPKFDTKSGRADHARELRELITPFFRERSKIESYHEAQRLGLPVGYVADFDDLFESPQYRARGFWHAIDHPVVGEARYPGTPYRIDGRSIVLGRAPIPGEHGGSHRIATLAGLREETAHGRVD